LLMESMETVSDRIGVALLNNIQKTALITFGPIDSLNSSDQFNLKGQRHNNTLQDRSKSNSSSDNSVGEGSQKLLA